MLQDTFEFNSAKAKSLRLKAEAHRWDARVAELRGLPIDAKEYREVAESLDLSAATHERWARQAPDAPKAEPAEAPVDAQRVAVVRVVNTVHAGTVAAMADSRGAEVIAAVMGAPPAAPVPTVQVMADTPRQREAMASHLESLAVAMRRGAVLVSGALYTMGPLHLAGEIQLGEPATCSFPYCATDGRDCAKTCPAFKAVKP